MAASSHFHSDSYLGAHFRQLRGMLMHGQAWGGSGCAGTRNQTQGKRKLALQRKAAALGFRLEPAA